jgi:hypothetical protein
MEGLRRPRAFLLVMTLCICANGRAEEHGKERPRPPRPGWVMVHLPPQMIVEKMETSDGRSFDICRPVQKVVYVPRIVAPFIRYGVVPLMELPQQIRWSEACLAEEVFLLYVRVRVWMETGDWPRNIMFAF